MRFFRRRRVVRRRPVVRRRRIIRRHVKPKGAGEMGRRFFKLSRLVNFQTSATVTQISHVFTDDPSAFTDWANIQNLFDFYRVCAMKIKYVPTFTESFSGGTAGDTNYFGPHICWYDPNSDASPAGVTRDVVLQYENSRIFNGQRMFSYYKKFFTRAVKVVDGEFVDMKGYIRTSQPQSNRYIGLLSSSPVQATPTTYAFVKQDIYLVAKARR